VLTSQGQNRIHQNDNTEISEAGIKQAELLAKRLKQLKLKKIISSNYKRAVQTADIINKGLKLPLEVSELFREVRNPSEIIGRSKEEEFTQGISKLIKENFHNLNIKFSDEEKYDEMLLRADKAIKLIEEDSFDELLIVTHSLFLCVLLARIIFREKLTSYILKDIMDHFRTSNSGITICEIEDDNFWNILTWNDLSHLG
jgi:broad specificity phosphatase PhoE